MKAPGAEELMEDPAALVSAASDGDQEAWNALVEHYTGLVWSVARGYRLGAADAGDVVQTTWLRLVENLDRLREPERVGAWLCTTARRECLQKLRHGERQVPCAEMEPLHATMHRASGPEHEVVDADRDRRLRAALDGMSGRCRTLLRILMADAAPSYEEVGAALGMPVGSIGPTRARCLQRLRLNVEALGITVDALGEQ